MQVFSALQLGALSLFSQFQYFVSRSPFDCDTGEAEREREKKREIPGFAASADVC